MQCGLNLSNNPELALVLAKHISCFLTEHEALWRIHVVDFFQERLWEKVPTSWLQDLQNASIEDLLHLPSGHFQDAWCNSLKDFVHTASSLALLRKPGDAVERVFPGLPKGTISNVLSQGLNSKKHHEVEVLAAVINQVAEAVNATNVVDVGAGQGYLAEVLAFEYQLPVLAVDACEHHAIVTNKRAERIQKYYQAREQKSKTDPLCFSVPRTITCRIVPGNDQMNLHSVLSKLNSREFVSKAAIANSLKKTAFIKEKCSSLGNLNSDFAHVSLNDAGKPYCSIVLAGLHACGDLSATVLRTYLDCEDVKAAIIIGCCYNLLTEEKDGSHLAAGDVSGFPLSRAIRSLGLSLGKRGCDLACQSAERWKDIGNEAAKQNFEQHAFRAAFQLILSKYYPEVARISPSVGRIGKNQRRRQARRLSSGSKLGSCGISFQKSCNKEIHDKQSMFQEYVSTAFAKLGLEPIAPEELSQIWIDVQPHVTLIGIVWSLRAVLAPVLEAYILLDRLIYLQESSCHNKVTRLESDKSMHPPILIPLFDPSISPRNVAIVAMKSR